MFWKSCRYIYSDFVTITWRSWGGIDERYYHNHSTLPSNFVFSPILRSFLKSHDAQRWRAGEADPSHETVEIREKGTGSRR